MRVLIDTDALCKLAAIGLLEEAATRLGADPKAIERLPALPAMLRRGHLRRELGADLADELLAIANSLPVIPIAPAKTAELLAGRPEIDPGEVQLLALTAEADVLLLSGDKRALRAAANQTVLAARLSRKVVCLEAILLGLCESLGEARVRQAAKARLGIDKVFSICLSPGNASPTDCLQRYLSDIQGQMRPLVLWAPAEAPG